MVAGYRANENQVRGKLGLEENQVVITVIAPLQTTVRTSAEGSGV